MSGIVRERFFVNNKKLQLKNVRNVITVHLY